MSWNVLHVKPRCEKKMAEYCQVLSLEHYLPLRRETKIYQRRKVTVDKPVFPGYFFSNFDREGRLGLLKSNLVVRVLDPEGDERLVHELAQIRSALAVDPTLGASLALHQGVMVRITGGPFMGVEGMVDMVRGTNKVRLNVNLIGQAVTVEADRAYLEIID